MRGVKKDGFPHRGPAVLILGIFALALAAAALPALSFAGVDEEPAREVISAWDGGTRGVFEMRPADRLREGQEFPVVRKDEIVGIFSLYYVGDFNAWGVFSSSEPELRLRAGDSVVVFTSAMKKRPGSAPKVWKGRVRFGIPQGVMVLAFVEGGMAEGIKPGDRGEVFVGEKPAGAYGVMHVSEHCSTGILERTQREEFDIGEFLVRFERPGTLKK
ncbi:MAG: hypothetical protein ABIH66_03620 [bacterium]